MTRRILDAALLAELASVDTPTICKAVEAFKARDDSEGFTGARVRCLTPELGVMAGYAVTATCDSRTPGQPRRREACLTSRSPRRRPRALSKSGSDPVL